MLYSGNKIKVLHLQPCSHINLFFYSSSVFQLICILVYDTMSCDVFFEMVVCCGHYFQYFYDITLSSKSWITLFYCTLSFLWLKMDDDCLNSCYNRLFWIFLWLVIGCWLLIDFPNLILRFFACNIHYFIIYTWLYFSHVHYFLLLLLFECVQVTCF